MELRDKVIEGLECCAVAKDMDRCTKCPYCSSCGTTFGSFAEIAHDALKLLKMQGPVKPIRNLGISRCGQCNREIDRYDGVRFCPGCGREVKWND